MSKLDEIQKRRVKYEKALAKYQKNSNIETMGGRNAHEEYMVARDEFCNGADMLLLLEVAEAAREYKTMSDNADNRSQDEFVWVVDKLFKAVAALE